MCSVCSRSRRHQQQAGRSAASPFSRAPQANPEEEAMLPPAFVHHTTTHETTLQTHTYRDKTFHKTLTALFCCWAADFRRGFVTVVLPSYHFASPRTTHTQTPSHRTRDSAQQQQPQQPQQQQQQPSGKPPRRRRLALPPHLPPQAPHHTTPPPPHPRSQQPWRQQMK